MSDDAGDENDLEFEDLYQEAAQARGLGHLEFISRYWAGILLLFLILVCVLSAAMHDIMRPTEAEMLRACAEGCGPGRFVSYERFDGCECQRGAP